MSKLFRHIFALVSLLLALSISDAVAQKATSVAEQKKRVEQYKRDLEKTKREVSELKRQKGSATKQVDKLTQQMNQRTSYIAETERKRDLLSLEADKLNQQIDSLLKALEHNKKVYAEVVRVAYRNYAANGSTAYLFSSTSISDAAHRMVNVRHIAEQRAALAEQIKEQGRRLVSMRNELQARRVELDSLGRSLEREHRELQRDRDEAKRTYEKLSEQERKALNEQKRQQKQLEEATKELRKLTEGNKVGKGFSTSTKNLNLPVEGGKTEKMQKNMVKIIGSKGNAVRSIYEGKVVRILVDNTNHATVMIAHGHYVSVYSHLSQIRVKEGDVVKRNQTIGTIGIGVDHKGTMSAYMQFMIVNTESNAQVDVMDCFKK
jgi:septal ring factor EnvC (AmiA/AmiB activator)